MWGYAGPVSADGKRESLQAAFAGVTYATPSAPTLLFTYSLELVGAVDITFSRNEIPIKVNGKVLEQPPLTFAVHRIPFSPQEIYPPANYTHRLIDQKNNKWEIRKLSPLLKHLQPGKPEIVAFPSTQITVIKNGKIEFPHDNRVKKTVLITVIPLWSANTPLTDAEIIADIPSFVFRGKNQAHQELNFSFNHKGWKARKENDKNRCPSLEELFRWKR